MKKLISRYFEKNSTEIILASKSERRNELLSRIISRTDFRIVKSRVKEKVRKGESPEKFCLRIAGAKAWSALRFIYAKNKNDMTKNRNYIVIGADTIIDLDNRIIGQPRNARHARKILRLLSGRRHDVITGVVVLLNNTKSAAFAVRSTVWFKRLSDKVISDYVKSKEPLDKAGAYGIQGRGRRLIARYKGSYTNIVGLPVEKVKRILKGISGYGNAGMGM